MKSRSPTPDRRLGAWSEWLVRLLAPQGLLSLPAVWRYAAAVAVVVAATALRWALLPWMGSIVPYNVALVAAIVTTALLGIGPGLLCVLLGGVAVEAFVVGSLPANADGTTLLRLGVSATIGVLVCAVLDAFRAAAIRARQTEAHLGAFAAATFEGIVESEGGRIVDCNEAFARMLGYTVAELKGAAIADLVAVEDRERVAANIGENRESVIEHAVLGKDGARIAVEAHGRPAAPGSPHRYTAVRDITARRHAEAALRESEQRMQQALRVSRSFTFEWRPATDEVLRSANCAAILGLLGDEVSNDTGQAFFKRVHPDDRERFVQVLRALSPAADSYEVEYRVVPGDGGVAVLEEIGQAFFDDAGQLERLVGVTTDITERKRAEAQLRQSAAELEVANITLEQSRRAALNLMDDALAARQRAEQALAALRQSREDLDRAQAVGQIGSWRMDVGHNVLTWSDENHRIFGVPKGTPLSYETFLAAVHSDDRQHVDAHWQAALRGEPYEIEHRIVVGDEVKWVRERSELEVDPQGKLLGGFGTTQDITAKKQVEEALAAAKAAAEAASEAKSRFLANVSHELRTPMNAILGMIDLALRRNIDATAKEFLHTARESADLLLALLNDLLDSAKIESGRLDLEAAPFSLRRVLEQTTQVLAVRASEKGIAFSCRIPPDVPDALVGDQVRLRQILLNLAGNGIKFTERGEVTVSVRAESRGAGEACLEFVVQDTGIGIPPSELDRLFRPFAQADPSTTRRFGGTGLGLAISSSLVAMMGGRLWVESEVGRGSTFQFTVRLPLASEPPREPRPAADVLAVAPCTLRILLVEDNVANQKLAAYILRERGHIVEVASDGPQALAMWQAGRYDVILMDVQMPGLSGLDVAAAIRAREAGPDRVPIIAMTAHAMKGDREHCLQSGMDGYLSKPIDGRKMIALVESLGVSAPAGPGTAPAGPGTAPAEREVAAPEPSPPQTPPGGPRRVCDWEEAQRRCFNSPKMLRDMIQYFFKEVVEVFPQMHAALEAGDLEEVGQLGHRLKGTVVYLGARSAKKAALQVERFCTSGGTVADAREAVEALERECVVLETALKDPPVAMEAGLGD